MLDASTRLRSYEPVFCRSRAAQVKWLLQSFSPSWWWRVNGRLLYSRKVVLTSGWSWEQAEEFFTDSEYGLKFLIEGRRAN